MARHKAGGEIAMVRGSGNIFADLGLELSADDALKLALARQITEAITAKKLTQQQVSVLAGIDQAKISSITRGRITGFSVERLMKVLLALGWNVEIKFARSRRDKGSVTVSGAKMNAGGERRVA